VCGPLAPFAGRAIRNALNNLYQREMRHQRVMVPEALLASLDSAGDADQPPVTGGKKATSAPSHSGAASLTIV
jgi:hypothetical protein